MAALRHVELKGLLLLVDWPSLSGHCHNYIASSPEIVLRHTGS